VLIDVVCVKRQIWFSADYLNRLRGGAHCNLVVLRAKEEGVMIVLVLGYISVALVDCEASESVRCPNNTPRQ
jgi:hypothetical protein